MSRTRMSWRTIRLVPATLACWICAFVVVNHPEQALVVVMLSAALGAGALVLSHRTQRAAASVWLPVMTVALTGVLGVSIHVALGDKFDFDDLVGDIDGFLIGTRLANDQGLRLQEAARRVRVSVSLDPKWRFAAFYEERFNSSKVNARAAAIDVFAGVSLDVNGAVMLTIDGITIPRGPLSGAFGPSGDEIVAIAEAWADRIEDLAAHGPSVAPA